MKVSRKLVTITIEYDDYGSLKESLESIKKEMWMQGTRNKTENYKYEVRILNPPAADWRQELINGQLCLVASSSMNRKEP